jgi:hypothetical protein
MEDATIITLGPETEEYTDIASFEEAFGEYSELFGKKAKARRKKRRAERKERKLQKIADKDEIKRARSETRQARRSDRKQDRQQKRINRRAERKRSRQSMRDEQQQARQARRDERIRRNKERARYRVEERMARKEMRQGPEEDYYEDDYALDQGYDDQGGGYDDYEEVGYDDYGYDDQGGGYDDYGYDDQGGGYDDYGTGNNEDLYYPDDEWGSGGYNEDYGWGDTQDEYVYDDQTWDDYGNFAGEAKNGAVTVHPKVAKCAKKACWNKELAARLKKRRARRVAAGQSTVGIDKKIARHDKRKNQLNARLSKYAAGNPKLRGKRVREVMLAKRQAKMALPQSSTANDKAVKPALQLPAGRKEMMKQRMAARMAKRAKTGAIGRKANPATLARVKAMTPKATPVTRSAKAECNAYGGCETPVEADLNPEFSKQKIVIPSIAKSAMNAEGTGSDSWEVPALDAPVLDPTVVDLDGAGETDVVQEGRSGADGETTGIVKKINWTYVVIGTVVAVGAIYALKKYKVLK